LMTQQQEIAVSERVQIFDDANEVAWAVNWSAVWVGALGALAIALIVGLVGLAVGAHQAAPRPIASWSQFRLVTLVFSVLGSFLAFAAGGWIAARIGGLRRAERAMLHGAIVWAVTVPILLALAALGAAAYMGQWYGGLAGVPAWVPAPPLDPNAAIAARNGALGTLTALLLGLMGSVIGGWMGSGEPMVLRADRRR
jgi:hypothetical protein